MVTPRCAQLASGSSWANVIAQVQESDRARHQEAQVETENVGYSHSMMICTYRACGAEKQVTVFKALHEEDKENEHKGVVNENENIFNGEETDMADGEADAKIVESEHDKVMAAKSGGGKSEVTGDNCSDEDHLVKAIWKCRFKG